MNQTTLREEKKQGLILTDAYHDFEKGMNKYLFFRVNNRTTSTDLVQDTFTKTWKYLVKGGKVVLMKSFLYHILNDLIIDEYRKKKLVSLDNMIENGFEPKNKEEGNYMNIFDGKIAMNLIALLPAKYGKVMRMRFVQDLTLSEMSLLTGQSKNTVAVQIHRGTEMLKQLYEHKIHPAH